MSLTRRDAIRLLAAPLALGLSGCSAEPPEARGRIQASLWYAYGGTNREVLLSLLARFHQEQDRYYIKPVFQGDYFESLAKLRAAIAARAAPALTHVVGEVVPYLAEAGVLEPLDNLPGAKTLDLVPALSQEGCFKRGGERPLVALPFNRSTPIAYFNRNVLDELRLPPPRTWRELRDFARAATRRGPDGAALRWGYECPVDWWFWIALVGQAGGVVIEDDGSPTLGGDAGVKALELWQTLVHDDRTMKPPPGRDYNAWQASNTDFLAGRAAMIWTSTAFLRYLEKNASFPVVAAPLPIDVRASVPTGGTMFVMPRGAPDTEREAAWAFLRYMMLPAQANDWATRTGYMPVSRAGLADLEGRGYYKAHPNDRVAVAQLEHAAAWPFSTRLFRIQREAVQPRLEEAILARRDARATLDEARRAAMEP